MIHWQINPLGGLLPLEQSVQEILAWLGREETAADGLDPWGELRQSFPEVARKFIETPLTFNLLARRYATWLPVLAEIDPEFAMRALDFQRLKTSLVGDCPTGQVSGNFLASALESASMALTMTVMANNHFMRVYDMLEKPEIYGDWIGFMPSFLSAVLYHKVLVLRRLASVSDG